MTVARDILTDAARVFVLQQNSTVLGVCSTRERALEDAQQFMQSSNGPWTDFSQTMWKSRATGAILAVIAHDLR